MIVPDIDVSYNEHDGRATVNARLVDAETDEELEIDSVMYQYDPVDESDENHGWWCYPTDRYKLPDKVDASAVQHELEEYFSEHDDNLEHDFCSRIENTAYMISRGMIDAADVNN